MYFYLALLVGAAVCWAGFRLVELLKLRGFTRAHGCEPARSMPQSERIVGLGLFLDDVAAAREHRTLQTAQRRFRELGNTFSGVCMGQYFLTTVDSDNVRALLSTRMEDFDSGKKALFGPFIGDSMLTSDGAVWRHSRALVRPHLARDRVADLGKLEGHMQNFFSRLPLDGTTVDLHHLFAQLTFDNTMGLLLDENVCSLLSRPGSRLAQVVEAFERVGGFVNKRAALGPLLRIYRDTEFEAKCKVLHDFVDEIVRKAYNDRGSRQFGSEEKARGFLASILDDTDDLVKIRFEILGLLLAGRDTAADLMGNLFFVLARRPDVWDKLKKEVDDVLQGRKPTYDSLRELTYHRYVIEEALRLYPPAPVLFRAANRNTVLPRGGGADGRSPVVVPRGTIVSCSTFALQRRHDVYGSDADEFRPERWEAMEKLRTRPRWEFLPFSAGPRVCMGQTYAMAEMAYIVARMAQEFDAIQSRTGAPWVEKWSITLSSAAGTRVGLVPR
ncbi:cytochrome P450 [Lasiosphaeria ovina]|uniref:Cytochrome P450 n=1 Tax=Lasiosphaeria ovina TaxID=92902 RepID=A0AAE0JWQ4_9PEZI|nr:cytochrome P450 [Lasiosphaeria ovina]